jgi:hypothetical protein
MKIAYTYPPLEDLGGPDVGCYGKSEMQEIER